MSDWFRDYHIDIWRGFFTTCYLMFPHDSSTLLAHYQPLPVATGQNHAENLARFHLTTWRPVYPRLVMRVTLVAYSITSNRNVPIWTPGKYQWFGLWLL